jgi:hypothetical protein
MRPWCSAEPEATARPSVGYVAADILEQRVSDVGRGARAPLANVAPAGLCGQLGGAATARGSVKVKSAPPPSAS